MIYLSYHIALRYVRWKKKKKNETQTLDSSCIFRVSVYPYDTIRTDIHDNFILLFLLIKPVEKFRFGESFTKLRAIYSSLFCWRRLHITGVGDRKTHLLCQEDASESIPFVTKFKVTEQNKRVRRNNWRTKHNRTPRKWESHMMKKILTPSVISSQPYENWQTEQMLTIIASKVRKK